MIVPPAAAGDAPSRVILHAAQVTPYVWLMPNIQHPIDMLLPPAYRTNLMTDIVVGKWDLKGQARDSHSGATSGATQGAISDAISAPRGDAGQAQSERAQKRSGGCQGCL